MKFQVFPLTNSAILYLYAQRSAILINPDYQRMGEVWTLDKQQLLIDSILNRFDIPKIYFHDLRDYDPKSKYEYSIVDGRQRLEAIWGFIDGNFTLDENFKYLRDPKVKAGGLTYGELASKYPHIKQLFDATSLSVFNVQTDDIELIEDMFSRLNEAVPLNAAEKRNAFRGPLPKLARKVSELNFFVNNLRISNKRYQHRDLAAKMLYLTHNEEVVDTKKIYLDEFFKEHAGSESSIFSRTMSRTRTTLRLMASTFIKSDTLLRSSGMIVLYYLLFEQSIKEKWRRGPTRSKLLEFDEVRSENRKKAERSIKRADYDLLEFDRLTQTPNDAYAIKFRLGLLERFVKGK